MRRAYFLFCTPVTSQPHRTSILCRDAAEKTKKGPFRRNFDTCWSILEIGSSVSESFSSIGDDSDKGPARIALRGFSRAPHRRDAALQSSGV
jgi:hypothetical protein